MSKDNITIQSPINEEINLTSGITDEKVISSGITTNLIIKSPIGIEDAATGIGTMIIESTFIIG